jgi:hypothetical protein
MLFLSENFCGGIHINKILIIAENETYEAVWIKSHEDTYSLPNRKHCVFIT